MTNSTQSTARGGGRHTSRGPPPRAARRSRRGPIDRGTGSVQTVLEGLATPIDARRSNGSHRPNNKHRGAQRGASSMCDYSLEHLAWRPARVGDTLVTTKFRQSLTGGFCAIGEPNVAVCLQPGTELAFDSEIEAPSGFWMRPNKLGANVARFRRVNESCRTMHHDALELPGGRIVLLNSSQRRPTRDRPPTARVRAAARGGRRAGTGDL